MSTSVNSARLDVLLDDYARLLGSDPGSAIVDQIFPVVDVPTLTGKFINVSGGFASQSPGNRLIMVDGQTEPMTIDVAMSQIDGWNVEQCALGTKVTKRTQQALLRNGIDTRVVHTAILVREYAVYRERLAEAIAFSTAVFTGRTEALTGPDQWSDDASDPVSDGQDAADSIEDATGEEPNTCVVGQAVHRKLRQHPAVLEYSSRTLNTVGLIKDAQIAEALDVDNYVVGKMRSNTAVEGQTATVAKIWGKFALFCKLRTSPQAMTPQSCLQRWRLRGSRDGEVRTWDHPGGYVEQIDMVRDDQLSAPPVALGYLYSTVVA